LIDFNFYGGITQGIKKKMMKTDLQSFYSFFVNCFK